MTSTEFDTKTYQGYKDALSALFDATAGLSVSEEKRSALIVRSLYNIGFSTFAIAEHGGNIRRSFKEYEAQRFIEHYHPKDTRYAGALGYFTLSNIGYPKAWTEAIKENRLISHITTYGLNPVPKKQEPEEEKPVLQEPPKVETNKQEHKTFSNNEHSTRLGLVFLAGCALGVFLMKTIDRLIYG